MTVCHHYQLIHITFPIRLAINYMRLQGRYDNCLYVSWRRAPKVNVIWNSLLWGTRAWDAYLGISFPNLLITNYRFDIAGLKKDSTIFRFIHSHLPFLFPSLQKCYMKVLKKWKKKRKVCAHIKCDFETNLIIIYQSNVDVSIILAVQFIIDIAVPCGVSLVQNWLDWAFHFILFISVRRMKMTT